MRHSTTARNGVGGRDARMPYDCRMFSSHVSAGNKLFPRTFERSSIISRSGAFIVVEIERFLGP